MSSIDAVSQNQDALLRLLLDSMLKPRELAKNLIKANVEETVDTAKNGSMGDNVDTYA